MNRNTKRRVSTCTGWVVNKQGIQLVNQLQYDAIPNMLVVNSAKLETKNSLQWLNRQWIAYNSLLFHYKHTLFHTHWDTCPYLNVSLVSPVLLSFSSYTVHLLFCLSVYRPWCSLDSTFIKDNTYHFSSSHTPCRPPAGNTHSPNVNKLTCMSPLSVASAALRFTGWRGSNKNIRLDIKRGNYLPKLFIYPC